MKQEAKVALRLRQSNLLPGPQGPGQSLHLADFLLLTSIGLWAIGVSRLDVTTLGPYGLPPVLPVLVYLGVGLLAVSAVTELFCDRPSQWRMSLHAVALVVMLYATAPLIYSEGRYSWLYKLVGVVQYITVHGRLNHHIDIYQNWPGFFAMAAWFDKVAGVADPLAYAKWAQLVFELAALPLLYLAYGSLSLTVRQRWVAVLLYSASNWIGQDYFSPQALGTIFGLGIMAVVLRWLYVGDQARTAPRRQGSQAGTAPPAAFARWSVLRRERLPFCVAVLLVYFVLCFTHQLSPYLLAIQVGTLAVLGLVRPRWLPIAFAAIAIGYLLPRFTAVNNQYGLLSSFGEFFGNAAPPSLKAGHLVASQKVIEGCEAALSLGMWGLAAAGALLRRWSDRRVLALVLLASSPVVLLVAAAYGQEGILRIYLFSLPWTAALAALALAPQLANTAQPAPRWGRLADLRATLRQVPLKVTRTLRVPVALFNTGALRTLLVLMVVLGLFFPAFFGDDSFNVMTKSEVDTVTSFLQSAPAGPLYCGVDNAPLADTATYNLFPLTEIFGGAGVLGDQPVKRDVADVIAKDSRKRTEGLEPAYVVVTPSMIAYSRAYGLQPPDSYAILLSALARSPVWRRVVDRAGTVIYELPPPESRSGRRKPSVTVVG
jgi:hypothetical protein